MKNRSARHRWRETGGYDPALDGDVAEWGRVAIEFRRCGERRRIWCGLGLGDRGLTGGCRRFGSDAWRPGDLLVRDGAYLDQFVAWLEEGLVRTFNAGGHYHDVEPSVLYPALARDRSGRLPGASLEPATMAGAAAWIRRVWSAACHLGG